MTRTRYTGHPSPVAQVARRVCATAGGYTEGVETLDGARLFHGRAPMRREPVPALHAIPAPRPVPETRDQDKIRVPRADALLQVLSSIGPTLPPLAEIGRAIGTDSLHATANAVEALRTLHRRGVIAWWRGAEHECAGQHAIRIVATGRVLRSADCPVGVAP